MPGQVLLIEDDDEMRNTLHRSLVEAGFTVTSVSTGREGLFEATSAAHDVVVLDRMLPDLEGLAVLKAMRSAGAATPVLMLTALGAVDQRVAGLEAGADDYLTKPFSFAELAARLEALMRRPAPKETETTLVSGDLELDLIARTAQRDGEEIELQRMEFLLLEYLMRRAGQVVTRTMLLEGVWGLRFDPQTNVIDVHVSRLRKKIDREGEPSMIQTLRGVGYKLVAGA